MKGSRTGRPKWVAAVLVFAALALGSLTLTTASPADAASWQTKHKYIRCSTLPNVLNSGTGVVQIWVHYQQRDREINVFQVDYKAQYSGAKDWLTFNRDGNPGGESVSFRGNGRWQSVRPNFYWRFLEKEFHLESYNCGKRIITRR